MRLHLHRVVQASMPPSPTPIPAQDASADMDRLLATLARDVLWYADTDGQMRHVTGAVEQVLGLNADEFLAGPDVWERLVHPEDHGDVLAALRSPLTDEPTELTFRLSHSDGPVSRRLAVRLEPHRDGRGRLLGFAGVATDVSRHLHEERKVRRFEQLLHGISDSTVTFDLHGGVTLANRAADRLWLREGAAWDGIDVWDLFASPIPIRRGGPDLAVEDAGDHAEGEFTLRRCDGSERPCFTSFSLVRDQRGAPIGLVAISRDVTQDKILQQQFFQAQKMESIGTLAGGVAHDFNNLLGGILGYAQMIKQSADPKSKIRTQAEFIEASAVRASQLTQQLLSFSRRGKFNVRVTTLNEIVVTSAGLLEGSLPKSILLHTDLDPEPCSVEIDVTQIEQVLLNLGINARDAIAEGGWITIRARTRTLDEDFCRDRLGLSPGTYAELMVKDTGHGMDSEALGHIFEPFYTTKELGKGTGLGLSVVYGIVKNHGGYIDVRSTPDVGTQFFIYLPISEKSIQEPEDSTAPAVRGGNERILVVDDEELIRELATDILQSYGYRVLLAKDGMDAIEIHRRSGEKIALTVLDMQMPTLNGLQTYRRLLELAPKVRVVLSSGFGMDSDIRDALSEGVLAFIQKPYKIEELARIVRRCLDRAAAH